MSKRVFWRIIRTAEPALTDFMSPHELGAPEPTDPVRRALHGGISAFVTEAQARNKARDYPLLGTHIVAVAIPTDAPGITVQRTLSSRGHHTIWGLADELLEMVDSSSVVPV